MTQRRRRIPVWLIALAFGLGAFWFGTNQNAIFDWVGRTFSSGPDAPPFDPWDGGPPTRIADTREVAVTRAEGGGITLTDGFRVTIPAGALSGDTRIRVERRISVGATLAPFEVYGIDIGEASLRAPATLRIPIPAAFRGENPASLELHHVGHDGSHRKEAFRAIGPDMLECDVASFSWFYVAGGAAITALGWVPDGLLIPNDAVRLRVPYYYQHDYEWCWAASAAMVIGAYGDRAQPFAVADVFDARPAQGGSFWPESMGGIDLETIRRRLRLRLPAASFEQHALGGISEAKLRQWLIHKLRGRRPIWFGLKHFRGFRTDHAVVLTGFDPRGFYVHDPSGQMVEHVETIRREAGERVAPVGQGGYADFHVRWAEWNKMGRWVSWFNHVATLEATTPRTERHIASLQVLPGAEFHFLRERRGSAKPLQINYYWNGIVPGGSGFSTYGNVDRNATGNVCNSDRLASLSFRIHNPGRSFDGQIQCAWGDRFLAHPVTALAPVKAGRTNQSRVVSVPSPGGAVGSRYYTADEKRSLPLHEFLDFARYPMRPGSYRLTFVLVDQLRRQIDRVSTRIELRPAIVPRVRVAKRPGPAGATRATHEITWDASPAEMRNRPPHRYRIYRQFDLHEDEPKRSVVATVSVSGARTATVVVPPGQSPGLFMRYVVKYVTADGLEAPFSPPSNRVDGAPVNTPTTGPTSPLNRTVSVFERTFGGKDITKYRKPRDEWEVVTHTDGGHLSIYIVQQLGNNYTFREWWKKQGRRPPVIAIMSAERDPLAIARKRAQAMAKGWRDGTWPRRRPGDR